MILEHNADRPRLDTVVLVGKGVTFDSGGISLKPGEKMEEMKGDMAGSAAVLSAVGAAARLKLPVHLVGLMPVTENMPSGTALKPGDILKALNGKNIEIINTDAEGRLILADALTYAERYKPNAVVDIATLTGACRVALGDICAAVLGTDQRLVERLKKASAQTAERLWQMPLYDEYDQLIKSSIADVKNSGGRYGGVISAARFLKKFIGDYPWAHIDIAGVDLEEKGQPYVPKGATGFGARLLLQFVENWAKRN
jgi:leucyl aminopeptidase